MNITQQQSQLIASNVPSYVGDPLTVITILSTLVPMLIKLYQACEGLPTTTTAADASGLQEYLTNHYSVTEGAYDSWLVDRCRNRTRRSSRKNGQRGLSDSQLDAITVAAFDKARKTDLQTVSAVMAEANSYEDD